MYNYNISFPQTDPHSTVCLRSNSRTQTHPHSTIAPYQSSSYPEYLSPTWDEDTQQAVVWARLREHCKLANQSLAKINKRYKALRQEQQTQVESCCKPSSRDTTPDHDLGERPWYAPDDLWQFKFGADNFACFELALDFIHNLSLMAEVMRYCKTSQLFAQYQEDICKLEVCMWEARQMKDASAHRLEGANALHRIEEAIVEINQRQQGRRLLTEHGCST